MIGIEEDRLCKPYRPFASGRIPLEHGQSLYLFVVSLAAAVSLYNGLILVSLAYMLATKADGWKALSPKMLSVLLASCATVGERLISLVCLLSLVWSPLDSFCAGSHQRLTTTSITAIIYNSLIFTTTMCILVYRCSPLPNHDSCRDTPKTSKIDLEMRLLVVKPSHLSFLSP